MQTGNTQLKRPTLRSRRPVRMQSVYQFMRIVRGTVWTVTDTPDRHWAAMYTVINVVSCAVYTRVGMRIQIESAGARSERASAGILRGTVRQPLGPRWRQRLCEVNDYRSYIYRRLLNQAPVAAQSRPTCHEPGVCPSMRLQVVPADAWIHEKRQKTPNGLVGRTQARYD